MADSAVKIIDKTVEATISIINRPLSTSVIESSKSFKADVTIGTAVSNVLADVSVQETKLISNVLTGSVTNVTAVVRKEVKQLTANVSAGIRGLPGSSGTPDLYYASARAIGGHRVVIMTDSFTIDYADATSLSHLYRIIGITLGAVVQGDMATIRTSGEIVESSWNWIMEQPIYLGIDGLLTQVIPIVGFSLIVGIPLTSTKMFFQPHNPIILN